MQKPLLYTYRRCPYAMRARMALLVAGVAFDAHEVSLRDKPQAMLARSPKGSVPVMLLPGGEVLKQSWDWSVRPPSIGGQRLKLRRILNGLPTTTGS